MKTYPREEQQRRATHDICRRMDEVYGRKAWQSRYQPLEELVLSILSQHTSDANAERAFRELRQRFPDWYAVRAALT
jgi:endonuclease-3